VRLVVQRNKLHPHIPHVHRVVVRRVHSESSRIRAV
jgi:hypothetical protein